MSHFICEHCGAHVVDSTTGYLSGCRHYPREKTDPPPELRYLNKKLRKAIDDNKPLHWEFGKYRKYYTGLMLIAYTGFAETGHVYESEVFSTTALKGAEEIEEALVALGIATTGWDQAKEALESYLAAQRRPR